MRRSELELLHKETSRNLSIIQEGPVTLRDGGVNYLNAMIGSTSENPSGSKHHPLLVCPQIRPSTTGNTFSSLELQLGLQGAMRQPGFGNLPSDCKLCSATCQQ